MVRKEFGNYQMYISDVQSKFNTAAEAATDKAGVTSAYDAATKAAVDEKTKIFNRM
jgi:hypothetical protein